VKQSLRQKQKLSLNVTASLGNQIKLLSLSGFEISTKLNELINDYFDEEDKSVSHFRNEYLIDKYKNILDQGDYLNSLSEEVESDLQKQLLDQLEVSPLDEMQILVGQFLIDSVEGNGRLDPALDFQDIKRIVFEDFGVTITDEYIEDILVLIQNFEPAGCAYRDINESLSIQVDNLGISPKEREELKENLTNLIQEKINIEQISETIRNNLKKLSLNPAGKFGVTTQNYVRPDVLAIKDTELDTWHVSLNDDFMSKELLKIIKDKIDSSQSDKSYDSKSFLKGLERRQQTLLVVSEFLIEAQKNFLDGRAGKRAISNKEISENLNISQSTVSRIVRNKYLQLPNQLLLLRDLLQRRVNKRNEGSDVTSEDLKFLIEELVNNEDKSLPYSDEYLRIKLKEKFKVSLSRRTVAKYRLDLNIPSSKARGEK
jgi:RNA polymerase sigma-54 factor